MDNTRIVDQVDVLCDTFGNHQEFIELQGVYDYFPYGKILRSFSAGNQGRYLSTYHERDAETGDLQGFDYRGARFYDSDVGRFLSLDPLAVEYPALGDYVYVAGNPVRFIDPDGKNFWDKVQGVARGTIDNITPFNTRASV